MSLLKKAQSQNGLNNKTKTLITYEHAELVNAFLKGEVTVKDVSFALGFVKPTSVNYFILRIIKDSVKKDWLKVHLIKPPAK